jgi:hypothetical protein
VFDDTSRYAELPTAEMESADGRRIRYTSRRFLPQGRTLPILAEVVTTDADRLDLLAARALDDPAQFWRICDANDVMNPAMLLAEPGRAIRIPLGDVYR